MKRSSLFALLALALASIGLAEETPVANPSIMTAPCISLGYVALYVNDVGASLAFYERAFGLARRFFHEEGDKAYGELETGAVRLSFVSLPLAREQLRQDVTAASPDGPPIGAEIAFVTADVPALYARALEAGATPVCEPAVKPWGQTVAYVRDNSGHLVSICTPLP